MLEHEPECIHLDCVKKLGMAIVTYFKRKVNFANNHQKSPIKKENPPKHNL